MNDVWKYVPDTSCTAIAITSVIFFLSLRLSQIKQVSAKNFVLVSQMNQQIIQQHGSGFSREHLLQLQPSRIQQTFATIFPEHMT
jgi:hypothetical protein